MTFIYIDRHLTECLYSICVEQNSMFLCDFSDFFDRLNCTNLIVCEHDRNQNSVRADCRTELLQVYQSLLIHIKVRHFKPFFLQILCCMKNCVVFDLCSDDMSAFVLITFCSCFQRPVIRLRAAVGKVNLVGLCAQRFRDRLASLCNRSLRLCRKFINGRRVAVILRKIREHRLHDLRAHPGGGCVVKINYLLHKSAFP